MPYNTFVRTFKISVFVLLGLLLGIMLFYAIEHDGLPYVISVVVFMIIVYLIVVIVRQRKVIGSMEDLQRTSDVGFVFDTFQNLVGKMKEDEKELEKSKTFAEEKAGTIEAYNENILQSVPSGVVSINNSLKIKSMNQAAARILGTNAEEVIGRNFGEVMREPFVKLAKEGDPVLRGEYQYVTPDKRHIWIGITTSELKNKEDEKIGLIFVFTDLTDIKNLQAQIELKQRLSQLGEMSTGISHELRNSMSVISGYAKLLAKKTDASVKPTVDAISSEIINMDKIISELLAFAKPTVLTLEQTDLNIMIALLVKSVSEENDAVKISFDSTGDVLVNADEVLLRQAFLNLLKNAAEAMPDGGKMDIAIERIDNKVQIQVADTGEGVPKEVLQKIFLPFFTTKEEGVGLGLALVHKIIVSHGGSIKVESTEGKGTLFIILLPV